MDAAALHERTGTPLIADGGMGTSLIDTGVALDACMEALNERDPARVTSIHAAFVAAGSPCFERPAVLVAEWSAHCVVAYELDPEGNPVRASRRLVLSGLRGVLGVAIDPVTGDVLLSTWRRDGTEVIGMLRRTGR